MKELILLAPEVRSGHGPGVFRLLTVGFVDGLEGGDGDVQPAVVRHAQVDAPVAAGRDAVMKG